MIDKYNKTTKVPQQIPPPLAQSVTPATEGEFTAKKEVTKSTQKRTIRTHKDQAVGNTKGNSEKKLPLNRRKKAMESRKAKQPYRKKAGVLYDAKGNVISRKEQRIKEAAERRQRVVAEKYEQRALLEQTLRDKEAERAKEAAYQQKSETLYKTLEEIEKELLDIEKQREGLKQDRHTIQIALNLIADESKNLLERQSMLSITKESHRIALAAFNERNLTLGNLMQDLDTQKTRIEHLMQKLLEKREILTSAEKTAAELSAQAKQVEEIIAQQLFQRLAQLEKNVAGLTANIAGIGQEIETERNARAQLEETANKLDKEVKEEAENLEKQGSFIHQEETEVETQAQEINQKIQALQNRLSAIDEKENDLNKKTKGLEEQRALALQRIKEHEKNAPETKTGEVSPTPASHLGTTLAHSPRTTSSYKTRLNEAKAKQEDPPTPEPRGNKP